MALREYFVLWAIGILCVFSLAIGIERMMKIILANYLLTALCITITPAIDALMGWLGAQAPDVGNAIGHAVANKTIITLVVYLLLFLLLFAKSRLHIWFHLSGPKKLLMTILCIPMTVLSIALTLEIAVLGLQAFDMVALQKLASSMPVSPIYQQFVQYTPIIICVHALLAVLMLADINRIPKRKSFVPDVRLEE
jgi:hypothetical protein